MFGRANRLAVLVLVTVLLTTRGLAQEAAALNPFGSREARQDALPGFVELSDGSIHAGQVYLTRDARLKIFDEVGKQFREVPLRVIQRIDCKVKSEWLEKEWRFKENANDEKFFTGHNYPAREYVHTLTLNDGRTISGPLSGIVYVQPEGKDEPGRYLLHKRDKGELDVELKALLYVRSIQLGDQALEEGRRKASMAGPEGKKAPAAKPGRKAATKR